DDGRDRTPVETHHGALSDLDLEHVVLDRDHRSVQAAGRDDLVVLAQVVLHDQLRLAPLALRPDEQEPHQGEEDDDHDYEVHVGTSAAWSLASAASLYDCSSPRSIALRAPAPRSSTKRRLCSVSNRWPRSSCWLTRWRR